MRSIDFRKLITIGGESKGVTFPPNIIRGLYRELEKRLKRKITIYEDIPIYLELEYVDKSIIIRLTDECINKIHAEITKRENLNKE